MQIASLGDRSHEMSNPILQEKIRKNLINLSSAESAHSVVSNNSQMSAKKKSATKLCFSWTMDLFISPFQVIISWRSY